MRTKTLLLTAALGAAGIVTSMAQVYSVNAVGYVNYSIPLPAGNQGQAVFAILANPLSGTNNAIGTILPDVPDGSVVYVWDATAGFVSASFVAGLGWYEGGTPAGAAFDLPPGKGFFFAYDPAIAPTGATITFVGEVPQGTLVTPVPVNYSMLGSQVPQSGAVVSDLSFTPSEAGDDILHKFDKATQAYDSYSYIGGGTWVDSASNLVEPSVQVGEGFFYFNSSPSALSWQRVFSVN